jgi:hypothetical protein
MKSITELFNEAWLKKKERGWNQVYIMVDLHGVVLPSSYHKKNDLRFLSEYTECCLKWLSDREDVCLILWSSSHMDEIECVRNWLKGFGIEFDFVNENPLEANTTYADFSRKPYFSILLDDKSGFEASDWHEMYKWIVKVAWHPNQSVGIGPGELYVLMSETRKPNLDISTKFDIVVP